MVAEGHLLKLTLLPVGEDDASHIVFVRDVTKERETGEALEGSHEQLKEIIAKNTDAMLIVNRDGRVMFANPAAEVLFQGGRDTLVGSDFGFPVALDERTEIDLVGLAGKEPVAEMRVVELKWRGEKVYLASLRDITRRKKMEETLRNANQMILDQQKTLIEEERLRVLLQMAGATAHELSQPLTILLGNIGLMMLETDVPENLLKRLTQIGESGKRISAIVRKIRARRRYETRPYAGDATIVDFNQNPNILLVEESERDYSVNDTYGHQVGDLVLQRFADQLKVSARPYDFLGRYGGEEFVVCLPGTDGLQAGSVAERMRRQIEDMEIMLPDGSRSIRITASFGTASHSVESGRNVDLLIKRADDALYLAKNKGRNCVCSSCV